MRDSPWYILFLAVVVGGAVGSIYFGSEVHTVQVYEKRAEQGRARYGISSTSYVFETDRGRLPILKMPIIGYAFGAEDAFNKVRQGSQIQVRIGYWPPAIISQNATPYVMSIY